MVIVILEALPESFLISKAKGAFMAAETYSHIFHYLIIFVCNRWNTTYAQAQTKGFHLLTFFSTVNSIYAILMFLFEGVHGDCSNFHSCEAFGWPSHNCCASWSPYLIWGWNEVFRYTISTNLVFKPSQRSFMSRW